MAEQQQLSQKGAQWLRAVLHCQCCKHSAAACSMQQCQAVRGVLTHIHSCPPSFCSSACRAGPTCTPLRQLQAHWLECTDPSCDLCGSVNQDLSQGQQHAQHGPDTPPRLAEPMAVHRSPPHASSEDAGESEPCSSCSSSGWGEDEDEPCMEDVLDPEHAGAAMGAPAGQEAAPGGDEPYRPDLEDLIMFAQYLLHSFMRWQGADARPNTVPGAAPPAPLLDAHGLECLQRGRALWTHLLRDCPRLNDVCSHPGCTQARRVMLHMLTCQDAECGLCVPVKWQFAAGASHPVRTTVQRKAEDMHAWMQDLEGTLQQLNL